MRLRPFLLLTCSLFAGLASAAENSATGKISGRVIDASKRPIEYAAIVLKDAAGQPVQRAATDAKGEFAIERVSAGDYRVAYSLVGGEPQDSGAIRIDAQHADVILGALELGGDAVQMQRVEVSTRREAFYNSIDRKTYNVGQDLKSVSGSASDLLQNIPSVQVDVDGTGLA